MRVFAGKPVDRCFQSNIKNCFYSKKKWLACLDFDLHQYENLSIQYSITENFFAAVKIENFIGKILIFSIIDQNIDYGYLLEPF